MTRFIMTVLLLVGVLLGQQAQPPSRYNFYTPAPPSINVTSTSIVGTAGSVTYYYWVLTNYASGSVMPSSPGITNSANGTLSGSNYVRISWNPVNGASSYTVVRTTTNNPPLGGSCVGCVVVSGTSATSVNDDGSALTDLSVTLVSGINGYIELDNTSASPRFTGTPTIAGVSAVYKEFVGAGNYSGAASTPFSLPVADAATPTAVTGSNTPNSMTGLLAFADSAIQSAQGSFLLTGTTIRADIYWETSVTNTALNALWGIRGYCQGNGEDQRGIAWNTAQTVTTNAIATANARIQSTIATLTVTGCAVGETYYFQIYRDPTTDTLGATANLSRLLFTMQ